MRELMGAILAGGLSTRMGRDKATIKLGRRNQQRLMVEAVMLALQSVCPEIAIVGGQPLPEHAVHYVADLRRRAGPLGGVEALLASGLAREYLVCPCDTPRLTPALLRLLLAAQDAPATVLRIAGREQFEALPVRIASSALPHVRRSLEEEKRSMHRLLESLPAAIVEVAAEHADAFCNVNTPEDLNRL